MDKSLKNLLKHNKDLELIKNGKILCKITNHEMKADF